MAIAYISIGTSEGNKVVNISLSTVYISTQIGEILCSSSLYETEAWGFELDTSFYNIVLMVNTKLSHEELLEELLKIELKMGRKRNSEKGYSSRIIDLDILFYDRLIVHFKNLKIPHPQLHKRKFSLAPLSEIAPNFIHPKLNLTIQKLYDKCKDKSKIKKIEL